MWVVKILAISSKSQKFTNLSVIFNPFPFYLFIIIIIIIIIIFFFLSIIKNSSTNITEKNRTADLKLPNHTYRMNHELSCISGRNQININSMTCNHPRGRLVTDANRIEMLAT